MTKKKLAIGSLLLGLLTVAILVKIVDTVINHPSVGAISYPAPQNNKTPTPQSFTTSTIVGTFGLFQYPNFLYQQKGITVQAPNIAGYDFTYRDIQSWDVSIWVISIPSGNLSDNNAYQIRRNQPNQYQQSSEVINGQQIPTMTDKLATGYSRLAFMVHGSLQATVSVTGDDPSGVQPLDQTLKTILSTWQWSSS